LLLVVGVVLELGALAVLEVLELAQD